MHWSIQIQFANLHQRQTIDRVDIRDERQKMFITKYTHTLFFNRIYNLPSKPTKENSQLVLNQKSPARATRIAFERKCQNENVVAPSTSKLQSRVIQMLNQ